jgi:hypothetical protein
MTSVTNSEIASQAKYQIEIALLNGSAWQLQSDDGKAVAPGAGHYEFTVEWGKLIFSCWDDEQSQSWRVMNYEIAPAEITLRCSRAMGREIAHLTLRDNERWREKQRLLTLPADQRRRNFADLLAQLMVRNQPDISIQRVTTGGHRSHSLPVQYARLILKQRRQTILAIGVSQSENFAEIDGLLAAAIVWLSEYNAARETREQVARLWLFVPPSHAEIFSERLSLISTAHLNVRIECFEINENAETITALPPMTQLELLNRHSRELRWPSGEATHHQWRERILRLAPELIEIRRRAASQIESYQIHGLEFARVTSISRLPHASFGITATAPDSVAGSFDLAPIKMLTDDSFAELRQMVSELTKYRCADSPDLQHPFYRLRTEAWLESLLRRNIMALDDSLDSRFVYSQIPAWRADDRSVPDLLTINHEGRLVIIEIKTSEDMNLPVQGMDYWLRVEQARRRNEFTQRRLFDGIKIAEQSPLLYLVAPRLRFHRTFSTIACCLSPEIEAYQFGINSNWRNGVRVHTRERINQLSTCY